MRWAAGIAAYPGLLVPQIFPPLLVNELSQHLLLPIRGEGRGEEPMTKFPTPEPLFSQGSITNALAFYSPRYQHFPIDNLKLPLLLSAQQAKSTP